MSDDRYLWDRSGAVDLEVERLERRLKPLAFPDAPAEPDWRRFALQRSGHGSRRRRLALAAALALAAIGAGLWWALRPTGPTWRVEALVDGATIDGHAVGSAAALRRGQALATGDGRVRIVVDWLGSVEVDAGSRIEMMRASASEHRMRLESGTIHALIVAPPRAFAVDTPAAVAVDLGCAYTLTVQPGGEGRLRVDSGWVALVGHGRESFLPQGTEARIVADRGPGAPVRLDAPLALAAAVAALDGEWRPAHLDAVLAAARPHDALTLWHLLARAPGADRTRIADHLAQFVPPPSPEAREEAIAGQRPALDAWWQELGLGSSSWWRLWRQPAPAI